MNIASPSFYISQHYFCQIYLLSYLKETSLQLHNFEPHRKLPLLHQKGWGFSFAREFSGCKGVIFLRVGYAWNLLFLFARATARSLVESNSFLLIEEWKYFISNFINLYLLLHYSTAVAVIYFVILYWCFRGSLYLFFLFHLSLDWWALPLQLFSKFGVWSFNIEKHSSLPLIWIRSKMFFLLAIFLLCLLMVLVMLELAFLQVLAIDLWSGCSHFFFVIL